MPKKPEAEPARPSAEAILNDIHNTLVEGFEAILKKLDEMAPGEVEEAVVEPTPEPKKEKPASTDEIDHSDVSRDISEWITAHPGCTAEMVVKEHHISLNRATAAVKKYGKPAAKGDAKKITVEMLREMISKFADKFGMNEALKVNDIFGGAKKVSQIPEKKYAEVYGEMERRLTDPEKTARAQEEELRPSTIDDVRAVAQPFVNKYGDPAFRELLKKFGGAKISEIEPSKYAALIEALANA